MPEMPRRRRRLLTLATLTALLGSGATAALSAPSEPDTLTVATEASLTGDLAAPQEFADGNYVVMMREQPLATYDGHAPGFTATRPDEGEKVDPDSRAARQWTQKLEADQAQALEQAGADAPHTTFTGAGTVAITAHGTPVVLNVDAPTYADVQAAVAWSTSLQTSMRRTAGAGSLIGRGSGEAFQLVFNGQGFVIVQASEGRVVAPHSH